MLQNRAYKFRLYPNKRQSELMQMTFGCCRLVYNKLLDLNMQGYKQSKESGVKWTNQFNSLMFKKDLPFLSEVSAAALQSAGRRLMNSYNNWFSSLSKKRKGKPINAPQFKCKHSSKKSYNLDKTRFKLHVNSSLKPCANTIQIEKIGKVKAVFDRVIPPDARLLSITVSQDASGEFYASICVEEDIQLLPVNNLSVGVDLGLRDLIILSNGAKLANPKWFRESQAKLKQAQRHLSRKTKGSSRYNKQKLTVARIHRDIRRSRDNYLQNATTHLVRKYNTIIIEDLNVSGMIKNRKLSKSIQDVSWSKFVSMLTYKCNWFGRTLVKINRFFPSSKTCSCCGSIYKELGRNESEWTCKSCGVTLDRDVNAAVNILEQGNLYISGESPDYSRGGVLVDKLARVKAQPRRNDESTINFYG